MQAFVGQEYVTSTPGRDYDSLMEGFLEVADHW